MVSAKDIQTTCADIVREFSPLQVILFGSYADGTPTEDSDVDLLVVMQVLKSETRRQELAIQARIPERFCLDLHVRSPEDIAYRVAHNDWFLREVFEKGDTLYEAEGSVPSRQNAPERAEKFSAPIWKETGFMNPLTLEWSQKAESDYSNMKWLQQAPSPGYDAVCFHAQQCIEKYLKAWLQEANLPVPRTHDLKQLLALSVPSHSTWQSWHPDFVRFDTYAVDARYPGYFATAADAAHASQICTEVRNAVRAELGLPAVL